MSFKNAVKLIISKFSLVWSVLLYTSIVTIVLGGVLYGIWAPTLHALTQQGYLAMIGDVFTDFMIGEEHFMKVVETAGEVFSEIGRTILNYPASVVLTPVVIMLIGRLAYGFKDIAVCASLDAKMSSNMKYGFWSALVANLRRSSKLVLSRTLFTLPFDVLIGVLIWATNLLFRAMGIGYLMPFAFVLEWVTLMPIKKLFFTMWPAYIAVEHNHTFSAMRRGIRLAMKTPGRIYSNLFVTEVFGFAVNILVGIFTLGAGLLVTIPLTLTFESVLAMTILYNHSGRRYYLENGEIYTPGRALPTDYPDEGGSERIGNAELPDADNTASTDQPAQNDASQAQVSSDRDRSQPIAETPQKRQRNGKRK